MPAISKKPETFYSFIEREAELSGSLNLIMSIDI